MSVLNRHPLKWYCWANPVLKGKGYSAFRLLKTLVKPVPLPLLQHGLHRARVNLSLGGDWLKAKGPSFSHASSLATTPTPKPPLSSQHPPASVYPSSNNGWLLAIKQHFLRNPLLWSNGITVGWFNPWIVNRILPLTRKNTASSNYPYYIDLPKAYDSGFTDYRFSKDGWRKAR